MVILLKGFLYLHTVNFLAHIYLSGNNDQLKLGNFIADAIKGRRYLNYNSEIQKGILLHREIDSFTDSHPIVKKSKERLHKRYKHYDGVIIDIFYDHFLAKNWRDYHPEPLALFVSDFYKIATSQIKVLPEKIQYMLPYMVKANWLYNYQSLDGIERVLKGMNSRTNYKSHMDLAIEDLKLHYTDLQNDFIQFFDILRTFSSDKLISLNQ